MRLYDVEPPAELDPQLGILFAALEDGTREWTEEMEDVSIAAIVWQPAPHLHSIGAVMLHIAEVEAYWIEELAAGRPLSEADKQRFMSDEIQQYDFQWPTPPAEPLAYYFEILKEVREKTRVTLREFTDPTRVYQRPRESVTLRWVLAHVVQHESYHGGQAVLLKTLWQAGQSGR